MNSSWTFNFGRYHGRSIKSDWTGINNFNNEKVIEKYITELISFLLNINELQEIPASKTDLKLLSNELTLFRQNVTLTEIEVKNKEINVKCGDEKIPMALFKCLSDILTSDKSFQILPHYYIKNSIDRFKGHCLNSLNFQLLQADSAYIVWCIDNVENFFIDDYDVLLKEDQNHLSHFVLSKNSPNNFCYKPIFNSLKESPVDIAFLLKINNKKIAEKRTSKYFRSSNQDYFDSIDFCAAGHESPCMCSDREEVVFMIFDILRHVQF